MRIAIRTDAALHIGTGHVMRCLTIANALSMKGAEVHFVCRTHNGHLGERIKAQGHHLHLLPSPSQQIELQPDSTLTPSHKAWLGESWKVDLEQTFTALSSISIFDWLVVDHYALDHQWESKARQLTKKIMVIDDLVDRRHDCDLLVDQTFNRHKQSYETLTPSHCRILTGSAYSLLRPEFQALRNYSLSRRQTNSIHQLLIAMGGIDQSNYTKIILEQLQYSSLPDTCQIIVVMGSNAPWLDSVCEQATKMNWPTSVKIDVPDMAQIMANSDIAIGAAGNTAWERCCLGLPTLMFILAENQYDVAQALDKTRAVILLEGLSEIPEQINLLSESPERLQQIVESAITITDGTGVQKVLHFLEQECA
jgi:UDP-2,4-diacetamido-2,4,6-trideoxy-beta-L-altropyranose hydrolase